MARRPSLTMGPIVRPSEPEQDLTAPLTTPQTTRTAKPPSRVGKVQLGGYLSPEAKRQLDVFAAMNGRTMQSLFEEMVDDFSRKHGLHRLAGSSRS
jgi:hypothetical protein